MSLRKFSYFTLFHLRGQPIGFYYNRFLREERTGIPPDTTKNLLIQLLSHCKRFVPYYADVIHRMGDSFYEDPKEYLRSFPFLTKQTIRSRFNDLKSTDLVQRKWYYNASGGSTGEPVRFIQDWEYSARSGAIKLLFSKLAGKEVGEAEAQIWGSERDIIKGADTWQARLIRKLSNTTTLNAYRMTEANMRNFIDIINAKRPRLIIAYADAIYELARFSEREGVEISSQAAVMTSAATLYPFMRETIENVFKCRTFNRYGSREVGDIACEHPGHEGLWVAPWGNYIEIVDDAGNRVPDGTEGEIVVTSLTNYSMPFIRYRIGDRGSLSGNKGIGQAAGVQVFDSVLGRNTDVVMNRDGDFIHGCYFSTMLFSKKWILKYQVVQESPLRIAFRIVKSGSSNGEEELNEIVAKTKLVMGDDCEVDFDFVREILPGPSGKYRYIISDVNQR